MALATTDAHRFEIGEHAARIILEAGDTRDARRQITLDPQITTGQSL